MKGKNLSGAHIFVSNLKNKTETDSLLKELDIKKINNPDFFGIEEETVGIEKAREIKKFFSIKGEKKKKRIVLIENGEGLTLEAQNGLLKTLEELSKDQVVIIIVSKKNILLPTVISRCQVSTKKHQKKNNQLLEKLTGLTLKDRLIFTEKEIAPKKMTKTELVSFLEERISEAHQQLIQKPEKGKQLKVQIDKINHACKLAGANISPQSVIDWLMISL